MPNIKLKQRDKTLVINIYCKNHEDKTWEELKKHALRAGYLIFPYHYYIDADGIMYNPRPSDTVPSHDFSPNSLNILVDAKMPERVNVCQEKTLNSLLAELKAQYPLAKVDKGYAKDSL